MVLRLDPYAPALADALAPAVAVLKRGGVVAYPTDTLYGLGVDATSPSAVAKLYQVKERDAARAVPLIAASLEQVDAVASLTPAERRLGEACWPGPLSLVVCPRETIAANLRAADGTIAIRVPDQAIARALAAGLGGAITATSANVSGQPPAADGAAVIAAIGQRITMTVDAGPSPGGPPSTIVRITDEGPQLVRAGAVAWERVLEFLA